MHGVKLVLTRAAKPATSVRYTEETERSMMDAARCSPSSTLELCMLTRVLVQHENRLTHKSNDVSVAIPYTTIFSMQ